MRERKRERERLRERATKIKKKNHYSPLREVKQAN